MKLLKAADTYIKNMSLCEMGALKFCLLSLGVLLGISIPKKPKKSIGIIAMIIFLCTYVPLTLKLITTLLSVHKETK